MHESDSLSLAIHAARAGQKDMARLHCECAASLQPDNPLVWLWLAWLSDSPEIMSQRLLIAQREPRYREIAESGITFAKALCSAETNCDSPQNATVYNQNAEFSSAESSESNNDSSWHNANLRIPIQSATNDESEISRSESFDRGSDSRAIRKLERVRECEDTSTDSSELVTTETVFAEQPTSHNLSFDSPPYPHKNLFEVAQAMLAATPQREDPKSDGLVAGVSVTNDPWSHQHNNEPPGNQYVFSRTGATQPADQLKVAARPRWISNLATVNEPNECVIERDCLADSAQDTPIKAVADLTKTGVEDSRNATVLIVDGCDADRKLAQMILQKRGYNIVMALDEVSAIKEIVCHEPCLILIDTNMPELDGYKLCSRIKTHARTRHIPVIMLSNKHSILGRIRGKMLGSASHIVKPFRPETLVDIAEEFIDKCSPNQFSDPHQPFGE